MTDYGDRLADLLETFKPKEQYDDDIEDNLSLFEIARDVPNSAQGRRWAADVLAVAFRNHGILKLANEGIYAFSYSQILKDLRRTGLIDLEAHECLSRLRFYKHCYRAGLHRVVVTDQEFERWKTALSSVLPMEFEIGPLVEDRVSETVLPKRMDSYGSLRLAEREILRLWHYFPPGRPREIGEIVDSLAWEISNPRDHRAVGEGAAARIWANVERLRGFCKAAATCDEPLLSESPASCIPFHLIDYPRRPELMRS